MKVFLSDEHHTFNGDQRMDAMEAAGQEPREEPTLGNRREER